MTAADDLWSEWYTASVDVDVPGVTQPNGSRVPVHFAAVPCEIEAGTQLVMSADGTEVVAATMIYAALGHAAKFPPGATVTMTNPARRALVLACKVGDSQTGDELDGIAVTVA